MEPKRGPQLYNEIYGMALPGSQLYLVHQDRQLKVISTINGQVIRETQVSPPVWDGLAIAGSRLYLTTQNGEVVCLGK